MPFTAKQRRYFHANEGKKPGMRSLAKEADAGAKAGRERPPVRSSSKGKTAPGKRSGR